MESTPQSGEQPSPLVTVFVACYNHSRFVEQCLESIRSQTYQNLQVIIFDDCSKDISVRVIERWLKKYSLKWTFIKHKKNLGICASLNQVLPLARGKYISMIATDDAWLPDKTAGQVAMMETLPETVGVLYSDSYQINEQGGPLPKMFIEAHRAFEKMPEGNVFKTLMEANFIPAMTTLIRKECYEKVGNYDEGLFFEDWDMWVRISKFFEFRFFPSPTAKYRVVGNSMTRSRSKDFPAAFEKMVQKYLAWGWLEGEVREHALNIVGINAHEAARRAQEEELRIQEAHDRAREAYRTRSKDRFKLLQEAYQRKKTREGLAMLVLAALHIPFWVYSGGGKLRRKIRRGK